MTLALSLLLALQVAPPDTVDLASLRAAAEARDPRAVQLELLERAAALRIEALGTERLPQITLSGQATVQSDVPQIPISLPDGSTPSPPRDQARAQVDADWALYDGGRVGLRQDLERARLAEQTAGVAAALYPLREATTEAYFGALLARSQAETLRLAAEDLEARLALLRRRAAGGAALAADADAVEAELIRVRQRAAEAESQRHTALVVLSDLTGLPLSDASVLAVPDLDALVAAGAERGGVLADDDLADALSLGRRPEFGRFEATQHRAEAEARLASAATRPTVSLFGQAGVGRPSPFDFLSDEVREYAQIGVRVRWVPVDWGRSRHEAEAARIQAAVARTEADALARRLRRDVTGDLEEIASRTTSPSVV